MALLGEQLYALLLYTQGNSPTGQEARWQLSQSGHSAEGKKEPTKPIIHPTVSHLVEI
jgi:hypothetical protein